MGPIAPQFVTTRRPRGVPAIVVCAALVASGGCASLVSSATSRFADNLSAAVLDQDDPATVRDGLPAYLLLLDSLVAGDPDDADTLDAASTLYAAYAGVFVDDPERAKRLASRARRYGERAMCLQHAPACDWETLDFDAFARAVGNVDADTAGALYTYTVSWLVWLRAHSDDFRALAQLPRVESALAALEGLDVANLRGNVHLYLGILKTLRPPALGGEPEVGREHFERAIALTGGQDLSVKVEYARGYARLMYERELHDRLLGEVVAADPSAPGLTLLNVIAQEQARGLLASADDYF